MAKKLGELIKEARTGAGFTQTQLAEKISGVTAADLSKVERGEKELSQAALKAIEGFDERADPLRALARYIIERRV